MTTTKIIEEVKKALVYQDGKWNEKKGVWSILQPLLNGKHSSQKRN